MSIFSLMVLALLFVSLNVDAASINSKNDSNDNNTNLAKIVESSLDTYKKILFSLTDILFSLIKIIIVLFVIYSVKMLIDREKRDNNKKDDEDINITILPFEVAKSDEKYNGKAISNLLFTELQRIKQINDDFFDVSSKLLTEQGDKSDKDIRELAENPNPERELVLPLFTKKFSEKTDTFRSLQLGSIDIGPASISICEAIRAAKLLFLGSNETITGSLQNYGPNPKIVASLTGSRRHTWEACNDNEEDSIPNLVRDLSFKIVAHLSKNTSDEDIYLIKTWEAAKYYTEALDNYSQYITTLKTEYLEKARINCIRAANSEKDYITALGLLQNLGVEYFGIKNFDKAEELFCKATEIMPSNKDAASNLVKTLNAQGKNVEAEKAWHKYEEAMRLISVPHLGHSRIESQDTRLLDILGP
jgi:tetratricopeptide (TPR) repeat protein